MRGLSCGVSVEKIKWHNESGINYEWIIQEDGVETHGWEFTLD